VCNGLGLPRFLSNADQEVELPRTLHHLPEWYFSLAEQRRSLQNVLTLNAKNATSSSFS
jgi:hypothetical protein